MSKEDEERYHKLLAENDQLQQLITAVSTILSYTKVHVSKIKSVQGLIPIIVYVHGWFKYYSAVI